MDRPAMSLKYMFQELGHSKQGVSAQVGGGPFVVVDPVSVLD
jgi:hypothetical protein